MDVASVGVSGKYLFHQGPTIPAWVKRKVLSFNTAWEAMEKSGKCSSSSWCYIFGIECILPAKLIVCVNIMDFVIANKQCHLIHIGLLEG